jgi:tripeptide aminopeptidase
MTPLCSKIINETSLLERFVRYVKIDTQAVPSSTTFPSSEKEKDLARILEKELHALGISNAQMDDHGYVYAHIPSNCGSSQKIAFLAHMDVAPDVCGEGVQPVVHPNFNGESITYSTGEILSASENHGLAACKGHTLITSDGTTLLGADDKAGVAAIMSFLEFVQKHPEIERPSISICFTPDEEIGAGVEHIDVKRIDANFAYTVDGHLPGEYNFENFFAWAAKISIQGHSHHPGDARGNMINAVRTAAQVVSRLPTHMLPETTQKYEPFIHATGISGSVDSATIHFILRAFSENHIEQEKQILEAICKNLEIEEPRLKINLEFKEQYKNMRSVTEKEPLCLDALKKAMTSIGLTPTAAPIRGGTDGARLSYMGLPCPNIFTGGSNFHSTKEWTSVENMAYAAATLVALLDFTK